MREAAVTEGLERLGPLQQAAYYRRCALQLPTELESGSPRCGGALRRSRLDTRESLCTTGRSRGLEDEARAECTSIRDAPLEGRETATHDFRQPARIGGVRGVLPSLRQVGDSWGCELWTDGRSKRPTTVRSLALRRPRSRRRSRSRRLLGRLSALSECPVEVDLSGRGLHRLERTPGAPWSTPRVIADVGTSCPSGCPKQSVPRPGHHQRWQSRCCWGHG